MNIICFLFLIITIIILLPFTLFLEKPMTWISKWGIPTLNVLLSMSLVLKNYYWSKIITSFIYSFVVTKFDISMKDFPLKLFIFITIYVFECYIFTNIWYYVCLLKKYIEKCLNRKNFSKKIDIIRNINKLKKEQKDWNTKKLGKFLIFSLLLFLLLFLLNLEFLIFKNSYIFHEDTPGMLEGWYSYIYCHRGEIINVLTSYTIILSAIELLFNKNNSKKEDNELNNEIKKNLKNFKLWYNY